MKLRARDPRVVWLACCIQLAACRGNAGGEAACEEAAPALYLGVPHTLGLSSPPVAEAIPPDLAEPQRKKFVQIEITHIHNPNLIPIGFEVRYRREAGGEILLGSFSPFPPDNPGHFIVATGARLRSEGAILVSLMALREIAPSDEVRVELRLSLRAE
jgi:hypothetical protein